MRACGYYTAHSYSNIFAICLDAFALVKRNYIFMMIDIVLWFRIGGAKARKMIIHADIVLSVCMCVCRRTIGETPLHSIHTYHDHPPPAFHLHTPRVFLLFMEVRN